MNNYEVRIERCKREDTKQSMIQCLDKASIDKQAHMRDDFISVFKLSFITAFITIISIAILRGVFE